MNGQVISFHYTLKDKNGKTIESSYKDQPISFLEGGGQILPKLEEELAGMKVGQKKIVSLKAADAYGDHDKDLIMQLPKEQLKGKGDPKVGERFQAQSDEGDVRVFTVTAVNDTHATVDGNHPLAGEDLTFDVEVTERREATAEEKAHGHVHGPHDHHH